MAEERNMETKYFSTIDFCKDFFKGAEYFTECKERCQKAVRKEYSVNFSKRLFDRLFLLALMVFILHNDKEFCKSFRIDTLEARGGFWVACDRERTELRGHNESQSALMFKIIEDCFQKDFLIKERW